MPNTTSAQCLSSAIQHLTGSIVLAGIVLVAPSLASAGTILAPVSVTANVTTMPGPWALSHLIDQSGLTPGYTSGVTDFDAYIAGSPTHDSNWAANTWASDLGTTAAALTFDLGALRTIETLAIWNRGFVNQGIRDFELYACQDASCAGATQIGGTWTASTGVVDTTVQAQTFAFAPTDAAFIRMNILNAYSNVVLTLGEVAFEVEQVQAPEPASMLLLGAGLAGVALRRQRGSRS